jgi:hypothetical protein
LRHDYQSIDVVRIWLLIERDLPPLKAACRDALRRLDEESVTHIMSLIGEDKPSEEAALSRLATPPKALPAPPQTPGPTNPSWETAPGGDIEEDSPV